MPCNARLCFQGVPLSLYVQQLAANTSTLRSFTSDTFVCFLLNTLFPQMEQLAIVWFVNKNQLCLALLRLMGEWLEPMDGTVMFDGTDC